MADIDCQIEEMQNPVKDGSSKHQTRINSSSDGTTQRIPTSVIKPIQELKKTFMSQVLGSTEVEVGIELVDNRLVTNHSKQSNGEGQQTDQAQNAKLENSGKSRQILQTQSNDNNI